jgi:hypothetical protein
LPGYYGVRDATIPAAGNVIKLIIADVLTCVALFLVISGFLFAKR